MLNKFINSLFSRPPRGLSSLIIVCLIALVIFTVTYLSSRTEVDSSSNHDGYTHDGARHELRQSWSQRLPGEPLASSKVDDSQIIPALLQRIDLLESKYNLLLANQKPLFEPANSKDSSRTVVREPMVDSSWQRGGAMRIRPVSEKEVPDFRAEGINCAKVFAGDTEETSRAKDFLRPKLTAEVIGKSAEHCPLFLGSRRYVMTPLSDEERDYPIAFSIVMHNEVEHFERLLRAIYRPQNEYCIHIDAKAESSIRKAVEAIVACFSNVFTTSRSVDVQWAKFSIVEPELICMEELLQRNKHWRYFINLTGQEFPLKTNWDLVRILKAFNGSNNMEGTVERRDDTRMTKKPPPPVPITLTKGSVHIVATREFATYVLYNKDAIAFRDWVKDTYIPDETFFSSLNHSPQLGVPGAYLGIPETDTDKYMFITRFKNWGDGPFNWPCWGQRVRYVCVFGAGDLPLLASRPELFANKFYADFQPATLDCMEELHYNRTRAELLGLMNFETSFYEKLAFVKNHI